MAKINRHFSCLLVSALPLLGCAGQSPRPSAPVAQAAPASAPSDPATLPPSVLVTGELGSPHIGELAPDFDLVDQSGAHVRLSELRGSVVVLAFVTSFCPFSAAAQPHLAELAQRYGAQGVRVVAVDVAESDEAFNEYVARMKLPFPVLHDPDGAVSLRFTPTHANPGVKDRKQVVVTSNLVIDREGRIQFFTLLDTAHFDAKLVHVEHALEQALQGA
jgi:peroxiredoxin